MLDNAVLTLVGFVGVIVLLFFLIARAKWHVFMALLLPIILFGLLPGVNLDNFIGAFEKGFGKTLQGIAIVIVLGSLISEALKNTGAIEKVTLKMIEWVGEKRMPLALTLTGFILGIAIFSDVGYVILNPLVHSSALKFGANMGLMATGLVGAMQLTHAMVPPTPGPLAAAALVGADVGKVIIWGALAGLIGALGGWVYSLLIYRFVEAPPSEEFRGQTFEGSGQLSELPSTAASFAPILVPLVLIAGQSVANLVLPEGHVIRSVMAFLGWPVVALLIGVWLSYRNVKTDEMRQKTTSEWVENALRISAMILVVTGLGGSLSAILKGTPAVDYIAESISSMGIPSIVLPFVLGVVGNIITGSTTVGVITAGSLVAPMLGTLGLSPEAAMLAGAAGSIIIKYVNSSYFWVCTSLSKMKLNEALLCYGGVTLVNGLVSFIAVYILWVIGVI